MHHGLKKITPVLLAGGEKKAYSIFVQRLEKFFIYFFPDRKLSIGKDFFFSSASKR